MQPDLAILVIKCAMGYLSIGVAGLLLRPYMANRVSAAIINAAGDLMSEAKIRKAEDLEEIVMFHDTMMWMAENTRAFASGIVDVPFLQTSRPKPPGTSERSQALKEVVKYHSYVIFPLGRAVIALNSLAWFANPLDPRKLLISTAAVFARILATALANVDLTSKPESTITSMSDLQEMSGICHS